MKRFFSGLLAMVLMVSGCELITLESELPNLQPSDNLVINELFTLPGDHPTPYSWLELYNPTSQSIDLTGWTLSFYTGRLVNTFALELDNRTLDSGMVAWTAGSNVVASADSTNFIFPPSSSRLDVSDAATANQNLGYIDIDPSVDLTRSENVQYLLYSDKALSSGDLELRISQEPALGGVVPLAMTIPDVPANQWVGLVSEVPGGQGDRNDISSVGIHQVRDIGAFNIHIQVIVASGDFEFLNQTTLLDSVGVFDVPFAEAVLGIPEFPEDTLTIEPNGLITIVNDEEKLLDHTEWGPGDERGQREREIIQAELLDFAITEETDTSITIVVTTLAYVWFFQESDQIVLKDSSGTIVDCVRYGDYVFEGPGADPCPGNVSIGFLPEFQSIQRYAGAYWTGNTANDFYVTTSSVVPTPQWYSQLNKP